MPGKPFVPPRGPGSAKRSPSASGLPPHKRPAAAAAVAAAPVKLVPFAVATLFTGAHAAGQSSLAALPVRHTATGIRTKTGFTQLALEAVAAKPIQPVLAPSDAPLSAAGESSANRRPEGPHANASSHTPVPRETVPLPDSLDALRSDPVAAAVAGITFGTIALDHARDMNPCLIALARCSRSPLIVAVADGPNRVAAVAEFVAKQPDLLFPIVQLHDLSPLPDLSRGPALVIAPVPLLARLAAAAPPPSTVLMYDFPASAAEYLKAAKESGAKVVLSFSTPGREGARVARLLVGLRCRHGLTHATVSNPLDP